MADLSPTHTIFNIPKISRLTGKMSSREQLAAWDRLARRLRLIDTDNASGLYLKYVSRCATAQTLTPLLVNLFCSGFFSFINPVRIQRGLTRPSGFAASEL